MKKIVKIIAVIAIICLFIYFGYRLFGGVYSTDWGKTCNQYMWIFKKAVRKDIDPNINPPGYSLCYSYVKKNNIYNVFHYYKNNEMYPILIWEFKDLSNIDLNSIAINQNIDLSNIRFLSGDTLDSQSSMPVTIKYGAAFKNALNINLDSFSEIKGTFKGPNYKGFYGTINKMSFSNGKGETQIIFNDNDNGSLSPSVFLLYKGHQSFYVIIINSERPFKDANIINILNLK